MSDKLTNAELANLDNLLSPANYGRLTAKRIKDHIDALTKERDRLKTALSLSCDETRNNWMESGGIIGCDRALDAERQIEAIKVRLTEEGLISLIDKFFALPDLTVSDTQLAKAIIAHVLGEKS